MDQPPIRSLSEAELNTAIKQLTERYNGSVSESNSRKILSDCIQSLGGLFSQPTVTSSKRHHYFFRARKENSFNSEKETLDPKQYTYVPNNLCTEMGRCHVPSNTVFYGSHNMETAIKELKPEVGEWIVVSLWIMPPVEATFLKFLCSSNASGPVLKEREEIFRNIDSSYPTYDEFNLSRIRAHTQAWSDIFLNDSTQSLSAAISHQILYGEYNNQSVDGIMYGSVIDGTHLNFALHPDFAEKLQLYKVFSCVTTDKPNFFLFSKVAEPNQDTGLLEWRDYKPEDDLLYDRNVPGNPKFRNNP